MEKAVKASRNAREGRYAGVFLGRYYRTGLYINIKYTKGIPCFNVGFYRAAIKGRV